jgi:hypothetical protein
VVAALLTTRLGIPAASTQTTDDDDEPGEIRAAIEGLRALRGRWGPLALLALLGCTFFIDGSNEPLALTFNDEVLGLGDSTAGLLAGSYGVGLALGGAMQAGLAHRSRLAPVVLAGAGVLGGFWMAVAFVGTLGPAVVMLSLAGVGASLIIVSARTLLQRSTDKLILARVLAIQEAVQMSGQAIGSLVAPLAIIALGPSWAFVPIGLLVVLTGLVTFATVRGLEATSTIPHREIELLAKVPFLKALPAYELEHLAQTALWRAAPDGTVVVTQGEPGDAFYVVAEGELSVTVDGAVRDHTLVAGDGFGEIALLHRVPRTATVSALVDSTLLMVSSAQFLASVTSSADGAALAAEVSSGRLAADGKRLAGLGGSDPDAAGAPRRNDSDS